MQYAPKIVKDEDMESLESDKEEKLEEAEKKSPEIKEPEIPNEIGDDAANYPITNDQGYVNVLREKFGHTEFREG